MKIKNIVLVLFTMQILLSCENCNEIDCFTPPNSYIIQLIDKETGNDLIAVDELDHAEIRLFNKTQSVYEEITIEAVDEQSNFIMINIAWNKGLNVYSMEIKDKEAFEITGHFERVYEDCCSFTKVHEFSIDNAEYQLDSNQYVYMVYIQ